MVKRLFLAMPRGCLQFVIVVNSDHTHLLFFLWRSRESNLRLVYNAYAYPLYKKRAKFSQVNYIQVLVTTPNIEKPQKVFSLFFFKKKTFLWLFHG